MAIQDNNIWYNLLRAYTMLRLPTAFSKIDVKGQENIPADGALIVAPNHSNAFIDALLLLMVLRRPAVFVARADMFRNPRMARLLTFFKIMPIMRMKDGRGNVKRNEEVINRSVDVLRSGMPFIIFPEGTDRGKRSLLPFGKGICRIAFQTLDRMPGGTPVWILPVGIDYGDWNHYRDSLAIEIGTPVSVGEFAATHKDKDRAEQMNELRSLLRGKIASLFSFVPDDEDYDAVLSAANLRTATDIWEGRRPMRVRQNRGVEIKRILDCKASGSAVFEEALPLMREFAGLCRKRNIMEESLMRNIGMPSIVLRFAALLLLLPIVAPFAAIASPVILAASIINSCMPKDYPEIRNSMRFVVDLILLPLTYLLALAAMARLLPWYSVLSVALVMVLYSPVSMSHDYIRLWRRLASDFRFVTTGRLVGLASQLRKIKFQ